MPNENLENLVRIRELKREDPSAVEIEGLIGSALVRLKDAKNKDLALESRFDLAYNAAHALSLAALRSAGYRSEKRYLVFLCTQHTLGLEPELWRVLEQAHNKRNLAEYEGDIDVGEELVEALVRVGDVLAECVKNLD